MYYMKIYLSVTKAKEYNRNYQINSHKMLLVQDLRE